jgi:hypothetical protein
MRSIKVATSLITLVLGLGLGLTLVIGVYAQGPGREVSEEETGNDISQMGLADPPSAGFSVLYMFTGVANDNTGEDQIATAVHCTNFGSTATTVEIQFFQSSGVAALPSAFTDILSSNESTTYSTQNTLFTEIPLNAAIIEQGSGRVLVKEHPQVICTAQLLQPGAITPTFMVRLPIFDSNGNPIGGVRQVFLPIIFKSNSPL